LRRRSCAAAKKKSDDEHKSEPFAHVTRSLPVD
jgi:hypothetical protein